MQVSTLVIVGVGLIGGSLGLAAKSRGLVRRVRGVGRQAATLARAQTSGAIDEGALELTAAVADADMVVFCTPVDCIARQVVAAAPFCPPGCLLTDAGSTKAEILRAIAGRLPPAVAFVGSHPLAGSEKRGPDHARADLFQDRLTVVSRAAWTDAAALERTCTFWQALGARVQIMDPDDHDRALALTSHLPHLAASALAGVLPAELFELTASGFRDTTRVAAGDPSIWTGIFAQNRQAVLEALSRLGARLGQFEAALRAGDAATINDLLAQGKKVRDALGN